MGVSRVELLLVQRDFSWEKESWFVPLAKVLEGVTAAEAAWQPPGGGNTIRQTLNHLNYYNDRILRKLTGRTLEPNAANDETFGIPGDPADAAGWEAAVNRAQELAAGLRSALAELSDEALDKPNGSATFGEQLAQWVMHDAYHTGQIALIRKQQGTWPASRG